jgi:hypothetical protein
MGLLAPGANEPPEPATRGLTSPATVGTVADNPQAQFPSPERNTSPLGAKQPLPGRTTHHLQGLSLVMALPPMFRPVLLVIAQGNRRWLPEIETQGRPKFTPLVSRQEVKVRLHLLLPRPYG